MRTQFMQWLSAVQTLCTSFGSRFLVKMFLMKVSCTSSCLTRNCHKRFTGRAEWWLVLETVGNLMHIHFDTHSSVVLVHWSTIKYIKNILFLMCATGADLNTPHILCLRQNTSNANTVTVPLRSANAYILYERCEILQGSHLLKD